VSEPDFKDRDAFDPDDRELCSDGNCTGVVGADGRCKVCGLGRDGARAPEAEETAAEFAGAPAFGDDDRELCPDGACIGLLGADGKCKVCGRSAAS
jgi:hypothetical protein